MIKRKGEREMSSKKKEDEKVYYIMYISNEFYRLLVSRF